MMSDSVRLSPLRSVELLSIAVFGQVQAEHTQVDRVKNEVTQPYWVDYLFKTLFGIYMLVTVVVLIKLLIAMMTDTYQRIQAQSDIEWKFGLSKLIRNMHQSTTAPSPLNLVTTWLLWIIRKIKARMKRKKKCTSLVEMLGIRQASPRTKAGAKWLSKIKKDSVALSSVHLSQLSSLTSFTQANQNRIENIADWEAIAQKYRTLVRDEEGNSYINSIKESDAKLFGLLTK